MTDEEIVALRRAAEAPVSASMADLSRVADDLSAAFATDPVFNWFLRDDRRHASARLKLFHLLTAMGLLDGKISRTELRHHHPQEYLAILERRRRERRDAPTPVKSREDA